MPVLVAIDLVCTIDFYPSHAITIPPLTPTLRAERVKDGAPVRASPIDCSPAGRGEAPHPDPLPCGERESPHPDPLPCGERETSDQVGGEHSRDRGEDAVRDVERAHLAEHIRGVRRVDDINLAAIAEHQVR